MSIPEQQLWWESDQEVRATEDAPTSPVMRHHIREAQVADEAEKSLGGRRRQAQLLQRLLLLLFRGLSRGLPVCLRHFTHRIGGDGGFCCDICFFSWLRIKLGKVIRGQSLKGCDWNHYRLVGWMDEVSQQQQGIHLN